MRIRVFVQKKFMKKVHLHGQIDHRALSLCLNIVRIWAYNASSAKWNVAISWAAKRIIRHLEFMWIIITQSTLIGIMYHFLMLTRLNRQSWFILSSENITFSLPFSCSIMKHKPPVAQAVEKCVLSASNARIIEKGRREEEEKRRKKNDDVKLVKMNDVGPFAHIKWPGPSSKIPQMIGEGNGNKAKEKRLKHLRDIFLSLSRCKFRARDTQLWKKNMREAEKKCIKKTQNDDPMRSEWFFVRACERVHCPFALDIVRSQGPCDECWWTRVDRTIYHRWVRLCRTW